MPALQLCPHCQAKAEHLAPWGWSLGLLDQRVLSAQIRLSIRQVAMDRREEPA
ncbi:MULTISPECIES: hypothetical protein [Pseudomonas]|uniref:hypothetical protein n=1 Tax=Pseudomonas TaxID=286 RepID=UPI000F707757|nr:MULTISPECIES: hypothetical protein [Pseudomonas]AZE10850.1 hypothetical protein C4K10_2570 [Pseudomonas chlororaphis subsp. aureofaciens]AZE16879.1 hypothetical protein C4K09_2418 [Pseudomonas chlororaphis subsp. aureofaciens]WJV26939.1 hypothetical protein PSR66_13155 [Pseudomonas chlororaphis]